MVCLAATEAIVVSTALFVSRHVFGYIFSNEGEVVDYVRNLAPFLCVSVILDGLQGVLSGKVSPLPIKPFLEILGNQSTFLKVQAYKILA